MSHDEEIYIIQETLKNIKQQAKKSGATPPQSILVKMVNLEKRLHELKNLSGMNKEKPEALPENLKSIRDLAIDYALGRIKELPDNIEELYEWLQINGMITSALEEYAVDIQELAASHFEDDELEDPEDNSSEQRLKFARDFINNTFNDDSYIRWICGAWLENDVGETAIAGTVLESHGQAGLDFTDTGIYKSVEDFLDAVKQSPNLVLENDIGNLTDERLLSLWED